MPLTVVIGAQFGGEGKGKIVSHLSIVDDADIVVRCGGPNSGHTVDYEGFRIGLRMVPAGFVNKRTKLMLAPGALVDIKVLFTEMEKCKVDSSRLMIDRNACVVREGYGEFELKSGLRKRIGSTGSGTGVAVAKRSLRDSDVLLAKNATELAPFIGDVSAELNDSLDRAEHVIVEGTQGFGLSLYHADCFPYATSRDTTASGFLSEVGLAPSLVDNVIMAVRTFPIRVEGESGPLKNEVSWEEVRTMSGYPHSVYELTTATGRLRRVATFDLQIVKKATQVNRPTQIAVHGADYLGYENSGVTDYDNLSIQATRFVEHLEGSLHVPVSFIGTGPKNEDLIDRELGDRAWRLDQASITNQSVR